MKTLKAVLAVIAALAATLAGLDLTGVIALMPPEVAKVLVVVPSAAAVVVHAIAAFQKELGGSGRLPCHALAVVLAVLFALAGTSCTAIIDPVTGRLGIATDPDAVAQVVDRLNRRLNDKLQEAPPVIPPAAVPVVEPAK